MAIPDRALSLSAAASLANIPEYIVDRALELGLAVSSEENGTVCFPKEEVSDWLDWDKVGQLLSQRLKRNDKGECIGTFVEPGDYSQKNTFILPFPACWLVADGGKKRSPDGLVQQSHYSMAPCVRWAWDFCIVQPAEYDSCYFGMAADAVRKLHFRRGLDDDSPRDHYCYGIDIIAPAAGVIMTRMGSADDASFAGEITNAKEADDDREGGFLIDHGGNEFSQIAHVLAKSIAVLPGQRVEQGQYLCRAGARHPNMPHLHWGVWDSWNPLFAQALPILISNCLVYDDGQFGYAKHVWLESGMLVGNHEYKNSEQGAAGDADKLRP